MGACTVTLIDSTVFGNKRVSRGNITGSSSYAQGGETFTAAQMGLRTIDFLLVSAGFSGSGPAASFDLVTDLTNSKLLFFGGAAAGVASQEAAAAANTSVQTNQYMAIGV